VEAPDLVWCPTFIRPPVDHDLGSADPVSNTMRWHWDFNGTIRDGDGNDFNPYRDIWGAIKSGEDNWTPMRGARKLLTGMAEHWWPQPYPTFLTQTVVARNYKENWCSPLYTSCLNYASTTTNIADLNKKVTHDLEGVNGAFYDGSVRWIPRQEVDVPSTQFATGTSGYMYHHRNPKVQKWARQSARPAAP
jgi:hypothetical protein